MIVYIILAICYIILIINDMTSRAFATYSSYMAEVTGTRLSLQEPMPANSQEC